MRYPEVLDPSRVGTYPALVKSGGGYVWDAVLEYRVWCHPERGAPDEDDGDDYYYAFETYDEALSPRAPRGPRSRWRWCCSASTSTSPPPARIFT